MVQLQYLIACFTKNSNKCLVTQTDTACDSKPITARSLEPISALTRTHISPRMHAYRPSCTPSVKNDVIHITVTQRPLHKHVIKKFKMWPLPHCQAYQPSNPYMPEGLKANT